jgi:hypothetical protein
MRRRTKPSRRKRQLKNQEAITLFDRFLRFAPGDEEWCPRCYASTATEREENMICHEFLIELYKHYCSGSLPSEDEFEIEEIRSFMNELPIYSSCLYRPLMKQLWFKEMLSKLRLAQKELETPKEFELQKRLKVQTELKLQKWLEMQTELEIGGTRLRNDAY